MKQTFILPLEVVADENGIYTINGRDWTEFPIAFLERIALRIWYPEQFEEQDGR